MCVTSAGADGGTPSDVEKAEACKTLEKRADSPASGARRVRRFLYALKSDFDYFALLEWEISNLAPIDESQRCYHLNSSLALLNAPNSVCGPVILRWLYNEQQRQPPTL